MDDQSVQDISTMRFKCNVQCYNEKLKKALTMGKFIPCSKDSERLKEPYHYSKFEQFGLTADLGMELMSSCCKYKDALHGVIFEGWEAFSDIEVRNKKGDRLNFRNGHVFYDVHDGDGGYVGNYLPDQPTLSDLADATINNPLKLKQ